MSGEVVDGGLEGQDPGPGVPDGGHLAARTAGGTRPDWPSPGPTKAPLARRPSATTATTRSNPSPATQVGVARRVRRPVDVALARRSDRGEEPGDGRRGLDRGARVDRHGDRVAPEHARACRRGGGPNRPTTARSGHVAVEGGDRRAELVVGTVTAGQEAGERPRPTRGRHGREQGGQHERGRLRAAPARPRRRPDRGAAVAAEVADAGAWPRARSSSAGQAAHVIGDGEARPQGAADAGAGRRADDQVGRSGDPNPSPPRGRRGPRRGRRRPTMPPAPSTRPTDVIDLSRLGIVPRHATPADGTCRAPGLRVHRARRSGPTR